MALGRHDTILFATFTFMGEIWHAKEVSNLGTDAALAPYPVSTVSGGVTAERTPSFTQPFEHAQNFPRNLGSHVIVIIFFCIRIMHNHIILVFFRVHATCSDSDNEFSSALVLHIIYTDEVYSDWKPWRNDHVVTVLFFTSRCCAMMYLIETISMVVSWCEKLSNENRIFMHALTT